MNIITAAEMAKAAQIKINPDAGCASCGGYGALIGTTRRCEKCGMIWGDIPKILGILGQLREGISDEDCAEADGYFAALDDVEWEIRRQILAGKVSDYNV